jgi:hypothetical protein
MSVTDITRMDANDMFAAGFVMHNRDELYAIFVPLVGKTVTVETVIRCDQHIESDEGDDARITYEAVIRAHSGEVTRVEKSGSSVAVTFDYGSDRVRLRGGIERAGISPVEYRLTT